MGPWADPAFKAIDEILGNKNIKLRRRYIKQVCTWTSKQARACDLQESWTQTIVPPKYTTYIDNKEVPL